MTRDNPGKPDPLVVHVAEVDVCATTGMGRIASRWRDAFCRSGFSFAHIGPREARSESHPALFPLLARRALSRLRDTPAALLVHEPAAGWFFKKHVPLIVFSHGLERRAWDLRVSGAMPPSPTRRSRLTFPAWRLWPADRGLKAADLVLVSNLDDRDFVVDKYGRHPSDVEIFKNGVQPGNTNLQHSPETPNTLLFVGSWIDRKGIKVLVEAASRLQRTGLEARWILAGTGLSAAEVLPDWPTDLRPHVRIIPHFDSSDEPALFGLAQFFVLPSHYEGQSLSLLQAMAYGLCCITTSCCGQKDIICHGKNGWLVNPGDSSGLAEAIKHLMLAPEVAQALGSQAALTVSDRNWTKVSDEVVAKVANLVTRRS